jgi:hypothetical protein
MVERSSQLRILGYSVAMKAVFEVRAIIEERLDVPGNRSGLQYIAECCKGHACLMPMRRHAGTWQPDAPQWGLLDLQTGGLVDPVELISEELIEMTDWEVQDVAVKFVRDHLQKAGRKLMSWQSNPAVNPSMWFVGDDGPEWVLVRAVRYPKALAGFPQDWPQIADSCAKTSEIGHFVSISVANGDYAFDPTGALPAAPLWRGHALRVMDASQSLDRLLQPSGLS